MNRNNFFKHKPSATSLFPLQELKLIVTISFQHDYPPECRPGGKIGNYIMFASATSGDRYNNNKFSECSKKNVSAVLDAITEGRKTNCFTESNGAFCGNKIVEEGEEQLELCRNTAGI